MVKTLNKSITNPSPFVLKSQSVFLKLLMFLHHFGTTTIFLQFKFSSLISFKTTGRVVLQMGITKKLFIKILNI